MPDHFLEFEEITALYQHYLYFTKTKLSDHLACRLISNRLYYQFSQLQSFAIITWDHFEEDLLEVLWPKILDQILNFLVLLWRLDF